MTDQADLFDWTGTPEAEASFAEFDAAHPDVWWHFQRFALDLIARGFQHHSAYAVMHRVRWETPANQGGKPYKIGNGYIPYYARKFHRLHPLHAGFFRTRTAKADAEAA